MSAFTSPVVLIGRATEVQHLRDVVLDVGNGGGAVVVRGDPGIGKSALLATLRDDAAARGMRILTTIGVESETHLPFAGLHRLLSPVLDAVDELPAPQREALLAAFGMTDAVAPDLFLIALAALNLVAEAATPAPVLLLIEDAHWLDRPSTDVLAFIARRIEAEPVALVAAMRDGSPGALDAGSGLPELLLQRLDRVAAAALLDAQAPDLRSDVRERLLDEAAGNPLALVELPLTASGFGVGALPAWLPMTTRLEQAFAARLSALPAGTRELLLVAALNDGELLVETLAAGAIVTGGRPSVVDLGPAAEAGLVQVTDERLLFRHSLLRSAIHHGASMSQRHRVHAAMAVVLADEDRVAWHRAAASTGPDEDVAAALEAAAARAQRRGGIEAAVAALERAARLSADPSRRTVRLLRAAGHAAELGRRDTVLGLMRQVEPLQLSVLQRGQAAWIQDAFEDGIRDVAEGTRSLVGLAERVTDEGGADLALQLLWAAALRCFFSEPGPEVRRSVVAAAARVRVDEHDARLLAILGFASPVECGAVVLGRLPRSIAGQDGDARSARLLGNAAMSVGAFDVSMAMHAKAVAGLRAEGRLGLLARALSAQAWSGLHLVDLGVSVPAVEEGLRLARETSQPNLHALATAHAATIAALRGDHEGAERLAAEAERAGAPTGARSVLAVVQFARGLCALGEGRHSDALDHLLRMQDPADPAYHVSRRCFAVAGLAEAAVHSGRPESVSRVMETMEGVAGTTPSPSLQIGLRYARAVLADDAHAEHLFGLALGADLTRWPFPRAQAQLAYGSWLRRRRRTAESRAPLRAARETFDALGTIAWGERARQELRASGETSRRRTPEALDRLTPQELQIARMVAEGLTNREIGERLYLSHRTVGSHLHRIFPKLGITSRAALGAAVSSGAVTDGDTVM